MLLNAKQHDIPQMLKSFGDILENFVIGIMASLQGHDMRKKFVS